DQADFLALFPLKGRGRARLIGTVRGEPAAQPENMKFDDVSDRAIHSLKLKVETVNWFSTYRVHHRVSQHFRKGNAFLLGDAAHIHSPVGGQGMNTGIGDAINLAWKLKWVLAGRAPDALLSSYEPERIAFAQKLVATTDRAFNFVSADGPLAEIIRTKIFPVIFPAAAHLQAFREFLFRTVSQILINYRGDAFSEGKAGGVAGGDRLPWIKGSENYASLSQMIWQVHIYGEAKNGIGHWCEENKVPLTIFRWHPLYGSHGLKQDAVYLMRPDSYVALADAAARPETLENYFASRRLTP
ncbi:MAG TPA: FAD-dependent monooxygenase, partial [Rhizomicrobium sp.]|nr:FAD-dependent monooxygenase [Rhizomicrobium sp.]